MNLKTGDEVMLSGPSGEVPIGPFVATVVPARPDGAIPGTATCSRCGLLCLALACAQDSGKLRGSSLWACFVCDRIIYQEAARA